MTREELHAQLVSIASEMQKRFGETQATRVEQLIAHAKTVDMCIDLLFDHDESHQGVS